MLTNGPGGVRRVSTTPDAQFQLHWSLRVLPRLRRARCQGSYRDAINLPDNLICSPVNRVGVKVILVVWVRVEGSTVVCCGLTLAEVVALYLLVICSQPFVINLVKIVRLKNHGANDPDSRCWLHHDVDMSKHHVPVRRQGWRVTGLGNYELGTVRVVARRAACTEVTRRS